VASIVKYIKTPKGKMKWHRLLMRLPIVGPVLKKIVLMRFAQSFAITIRSGIPLIEGIELTAQSVNNEYAKHQILLMQDIIERGNNLAQAAAASQLFSPLELQMLSVSEETGELASILDQIAAYYKREVDYSLKRVNDIVEPFLILILSAVVLILAFAVYLPIWNMAKVVKMM
jgi:MSHA biogenesis protein MshG